MSIVGAYLVRSLDKPLKVTVWGCTNDQEVLLKQSVDESIAADDSETVKAYLDYKYPVQDSYAQALPGISRVLVVEHRYYVLPLPLITSDEFDLVTGLLQHVGPVICVSSAEPRDYFPKSQGYTVRNFRLAGLGGLSNCTYRRRGFGDCVGVSQITYDPKAAQRSLRAETGGVKREAISVDEMVSLISALYADICKAVALYGDYSVHSRCGMPYLITRLEEALSLHQAVLGPLAYRNLGDYRRFMCKVAQTETATLRKWNISGYRRGYYRNSGPVPFVSWLQVELRSKTWKKTMPVGGRAYSHSFSRRPFYEAEQKQLARTARQEAKWLKDRFKEESASEEVEKQVATDDVVTTQ